MAAHVGDFSSFDLNHVQSLSAPSVVLVSTRTTQAAAFILGGDGSPIPSRSEHRLLVGRLVESGVTLLPRRCTRARRTPRREQTSTATHSRTCSDRRSRTHSLSPTRRRIAGGLRWTGCPAATARIRATALPSTSLARVLSRTISQCRALCASTSASSRSLGGAAIAAHRVRRDARLHRGHTARVARTLIGPALAAHCCGVQRLRQHIGRWLHQRGAGRWRLSRLAQRGGRRRTPVDQTVGCVVAPSTEMCILCVEWIVHPLRQPREVQRTIFS